jgi:hypothetical protein
LLVFLAAFLAFTLGLATSAQAKKFSVTGGGGQLHIGDGLALPIQPSATSATTGTVFPPLLVPVKAGGAVVNGTVAKPLLTAMSVSTGPVTKQGYQRQLNIPANILEKAAAQETVGVKFSNEKVFAVGTNIKYQWPSSPSVMSTGQAAATTTINGFGGKMVYSNTLGQRFGGAARFALASGGAGGIIAAPVTVYIKINATTPPCTHNTFGGTNPGCVAGILHALPTGNAIIGAASTVTGMTPGGLVPGKNIARVKMGATPLGTINAVLLVATNNALPTNMASSQAGPWTTGQVIISNMGADPDEKFTLSGKDSRTAGGVGTIQLVAGSVSTRTTSGPNANRGWIQLDLGSLAPLPSMSSYGLAATAGLIALLTIGYSSRRRFFGRE